MSSRVHWQRLLRNETGTRADGGQSAQELKELPGEIWSGRIHRSLSVALIVFGSTMAALALRYGDGWVSRSPILNVVGGGVALVLLCIAWLAGIGWWFIMRSETLILTAQALLPWGVQPFRSALGVIAVFMLLAVLVRRPMRRLRLSPRMRELLCEAFRMALIFALSMAAAIWLLHVVATYPEAP